MRPEPPDVRYARSGDVSIAYATVGDGDVDLVFVRGFAGDLISAWEQPLLRRFIQDAAEFARVTMLDKRGTGLSDRVREGRHSRRVWTISERSWTTSARTTPCSGPRRRGRGWRRCSQPPIRSARAASSCSTRPPRAAARPITPGRSTTRSGALGYARFGTVGAARSSSTRGSSSGRPSVPTTPSSVPGFSRTCVAD